VRVKGFSLSPVTLVRVTPAGDVFYTDANGMQLMKRKRFSRNAFVASKLDHDTANPIGGNYYPITSSVSIEDTDSGSQLIVVTDRGQGAPTRQVLSERFQCLTGANAGLP
jgi:hypothetical protein